MEFIAPGLIYCTYVPSDIGKWQREEPSVIAVGDRVEVTRSHPVDLIARPVVADRGDRGVVVLLPEGADELKRPFGLDVREAGVRLDKEPNELAYVAVGNLRVLGLVDRVGELDG